MEFKKYQHLEKFGTTEVHDIEIGLCYIFPKLDGTNAQVWFDDKKGVQAGSRNRILSLEKDNAGFLAWVLENDSLCILLKKMPNLRLYGEWLVPHTLKTYLDTAWRDLYVFDVIGEDDRYLPYEEYKEILDDYGINYITPLAKIKNPTDAALLKAMDNNTFLIKDNEGVGEGVVVKNYDYKNKYGRTVWAKMVRSEFKIKNQKVFGVSEIKEKRTPEEKIVEDFVTGALVEKEYSKIINETDWNSRLTPRLLNTVFYCLVKEESWEFVKKFKNPTINYKRLMSLTFAKTKELKPELF